MLRKEDERPMTPQSRTNLERYIQQVSLSNSSIRRLTDRIKLIKGTLKRKEENLNLGRS